MTRQDRPLLIDLIEDRTTPEAIRDGIRRGLDLYDKATNLHSAAKTERDNLTERLRSIRRMEPRRLVTALAGRTKVSVDDILPAVDDLDRSVAVAIERVEVTRKAMGHAWREATHTALTTHRDEVLLWVTPIRLATPWNERLPSHIVHAWNAVADLYDFHLPMVRQRDQFRRLDIAAPTLAMRRTWEAIRDGEVIRIDAPNGRSRYRVTAYWPDLASET